MFLVEVALACAVNAHELRLTELGTWKLPKMRYKGASVSPQKLHLQRKEPVSSLSFSPHRLAVTDGATSPQHWYSGGIHSKIEAPALAGQAQPLEGA